MDEHELFLSLAVAVAAGLLVGLERERSGGSGGDRRTFPGGARTHPLIALAGALATLVSGSVGPVALGVAFLAVTAFLLLGYARDLRSSGERGITSEVAFLVTFLLGAVSTATDVGPPERRLLMVVAAAVAVTVLLSAKPVLHPFARRLSEGDLSASLKFLVLAAVVLPLLPDRDAGPLGALNPFKVGLLVVLVAGVDFVGYAAIRLLGSAAALVAGLADVDAITLSLASFARQGAGEHTAGMGIFLATASNTLAKAGLALAAGGWRFGRWVALGFGLTVGAGLAAAAAWRP